MLSKNFSAKMLQLPMNCIKIVREDLSKEKDGILKLQIRRVSKRCTCPYCHKESKKLYDNSVHIHRDIKHLINFKYEIFLDVEKRRFWCSRCHKDFHEQYEFIPYQIKADKRIRSKSHTSIFEEYILFEWVSSTIAEIARRTKSSTYKLWQIIAGIDIERLNRRGIKYMEEYPGDLFLGIDEHSFSGRDMVLVVVEHSTKRVVTVLPDTHKETLKAWLNNLPPKVMIRIKGTTMDMTNNYQKTVLESLGARVIKIVDKFHIIQQANKILDEVRQLNNWMIQTGYYGDNLMDLTKKKGVKRKQAKDKKILININEKISDQKYRSLEIREKFKDKNIRVYNPNDTEYKPITIDHYVSEKYRTIFLIGEEKLTQKQKHRLNQIFREFDPEHYLFEAYNAKEKIRECLNNKNLFLLNEVIKDLEQTKHYKLIALKNTLKLHKQEILNYFEHGLTNARLEGKNNKAKIIKRISYGYRTKNNYIKKLLFAL
jgi:transposase